MDCDARRSSRSRKEINYSSFGDGAESDDGDFTDPTPPPAKKPREEKEKKKRTKKKKSSDDLDEDYSEFTETHRGKRKESSRKPLEDRMFDRELELALAMSKQDSSQETADEEQQFRSKKRPREVSAVVYCPPQLTDESQENQEPHAKAAANKPSPPHQPDVPPVLHKAEKVASPPGKKNTRAPAAARPVKNGLSSSKTGTVKRSAPVAKTPSRSPARKTATPLASPRTTALKRPSATPTAGSGNNPLGGVKLVSPGAPIRLGLSKFARIKPLHSNVKV